jgi:hypothetical protein
MDTSQAVQHIVVEAVNLPKPVKCMACARPVVLYALHDLVICRDTTPHEPLCRTCAAHEAPTLTARIFSIRPFLMQQAREQAARAAEAMRRLRTRKNGHPTP